MSVSNAHTIPVSTSILKRLITNVFSAGLLVGMKTKYLRSQICEILSSLRFLRFIASGDGKWVYVMHKAIYVHCRSSAWQPKQNTIQRQCCKQQNTDQQKYLQKRVTVMKRFHYLSASYWLVKVRRQLRMCTTWFLQRCIWYLFRMIFRTDINSQNSINVSVR
jgi:hypothetical protein